MPQSVCPPKWHRKNAPLSAAVESDVVGYQQTELPTLGFAIVSLPFNELTDDAAGFPIQQIQGELAQSDRESRADKLFVLDPDTKQYTTYQYKTTGWVKVGEETPTTDVVLPGQSVFFEKVAKTGNFTIAGKVVDEETQSVALSVGLNLVSNPYPTPIKIADLTGSLTASDRESRADKIMVLDPQTKVYTTYLLKKTSGWTKAGEEVTTTDTIASGEGFFYKKAVSNGELTFSRPF